MQHIQWLLPSKHWGSQLARATHKYDQAFLQALREYASLESARTGQQVSQSAILLTLALRGDEQLRKLYEKHQHSSGAEPNSK